MDGQSGTGLLFEHGAGLLAQLQPHLPRDWLEALENVRVLLRFIYLHLFSKKTSSTASPAHCLFLNFTSSLGSINTGHFR